ncbi:MAG: hypothetical protein ABS76_00660 [Pelagibacterium sp. SCN 64-44]|nr:MAG: hypothetical protein ABS76_00660 [Pelagibacterium sp. SCN 64-44]
MMRIVAGISDGLARLLVAAVVVMTCVMLLALGLQVLLRYAFSITLPWPDELAMAMFSWTVLLIAPLGVKEGFHARLVVVADNLPDRWKPVQQRGVDLLCAILGVALAVAGSRYALESSVMRSAAIGYPMVWLYAALPVSGVLMVLFALERMIWGPRSKPSEMLDV